MVAVCARYIFCHPLNFSLFVSLNVRFVLESCSWVLYLCLVHWSLPSVWSVSFVVRVVVGAMNSCHCAVSIGLVCFVPLLLVYYLLVLNKNFSVPF